MPIMGKNSQIKLIFAPKNKKQETMSHPLDKFRCCPLCGSTAFNVNNEKSKRCGECGFTYYFNPSAATVAVVTNERGELLVARRGKEPAKGTLDLPGGFCDLHETAEQGVAREVMEETGLRVTQCKFLFSLPNIYPYSSIVIHTIDMFFACKVKGPAEVAHAMDDVSELMWMRQQDIRPEDFGLESIRAGVALILNKNIVT